MRKFLIIWIVSVSVCAWVGVLAWRALPDGLMHVFFLDVGQGDSMLLVTPHGKRVLVDAGPGSAVIEPLKRAIGWLSHDIDLAVITHFDRDHSEGFLSVLRDYHVEHLLITGVEQKTALQGNLFAMIAKLKIPVWIASADTDFLLDDGVIMDVLSPFESLAGKYFQNANETSIVTRILVKSGVDNRGIFQMHPEILTTGDIGFETEQKLVEKYGNLLHAAILKVPHHGSRYSSGDAFLARVRATWAVISVGAHNTYHHPHPDALGRLKNMMKNVAESSTSHILRTDQKGTIEAVIDATGQIMSVGL